MQFQKQTAKPESRKLISKQTLLTKEKFITICNKTIRHRTKYALVYIQIYGCMLQVQTFITKCTISKNKRFLATCPKTIKIFTCIFVISAQIVSVIHAWSHF